MSNYYLVLDNETSTTFNLQPWHPVVRRRAIRRIAILACVCSVVIVAAVIFQSSLHSSDLQRLQTRLEEQQKLLAISKRDESNVRKAQISTNSLMNYAVLRHMLIALQNIQPTAVRLQAIELGEQVLLEGSTTKRSSLNELVESLSGLEGIQALQLQQVIELENQWNFTLLLKLKQNFASNLALQQPG